VVKKKVFNRIKAVLAEQGKTNLWIAEKLDVHTSTVSKWCRNEMQPTVENLFAIADVLGVEVRSLLISNKNAE
jgi:putative transcriptional regulator